jgi:hypothetical protein
MGIERPQPSGSFEFTDHERLYDRIGHERFMAILSAEQTAVHFVEASSNNYGEFLFVTMSQPRGDNRTYLTFWSLGFHEQRERWITHEWQWYDFHPGRHTIPPTIPKADAQTTIQARIDEIAPNIVNPPHQSRRAQLFEMLADLTDEDGATTELEDLGIWDDEDMDDALVPPNDD